MTRQPKRMIDTEYGKFEEAQREKTGRLVPCPGEAHENPFIDNCGICAPRWGEVEEVKPIDIDGAREKKQALPLPLLTSDQFKVVHEMTLRKELVVTWGRYRNASYFVALWPDMVPAAQEQDSESS